MPKLLDTITAEGFTAVVTQDDDLRGWYRADADIDADGANGQNGKRAAYMVGNCGSEDLANGGMRARNGTVIGFESWYKDIVICGTDGQPRIFPGGIIASKTSYRHAGFSLNDPNAYLDSETYPYIVISPVIAQRAKGIVLGCLCRATNMLTGEKSFGGVGDFGPRNRAGELSIEMARRLKLDPNPRSGGTDRPNILYEFWPGTPADGLRLIPLGQ